MDFNDIRPILKDEKLFTRAFEEAAIGMALVAPNGQWLMVNTALCALLGYEKNELLSLTFQDITHPDDLGLDLEYFQELVQGKRCAYQKEKRYCHKQGQVVYAQLNVSLVKDGQGRPHFIIAQIQDITERKNLERELFRQAKEDVLTGIANRRAFFELSAREISRGGRFSEPAVLLMLDIDHFKRINDTHGHAKGDEALQGMSRACAGLLRPFDVFGRLGGDEFAVLLIHTSTLVGERVANRLRRAVEGISIPSAEGAFGFTISIGGVCFVGSNSPVAELISQADEALYQAKAVGRNRVVMVEDLSCNLEKDQLPKQSFIRLEWHEAYASGHQVIDKQHRSLFRVANDLLARVVSADEKNGLISLIDELLGDVGTHFRTEEQVMAAVNYPDLDQHHLIHDQLLAKAGTLAERFKDNQLEAGEILQYLAIDVVYHHLLREDQKFFPYLA